jgi:hypothetical protein
MPMRGGAGWRTFAVGAVALCTVVFAVGRQGSFANVGPLAQLAPAISQNQTATTLLADFTTVAGTRAFIDQVQAKYGLDRLPAPGSARAATAEPDDAKHEPMAETAEAQAAEAQAAEAQAAEAQAEKPGEPEQEKTDPQKESASPAAANEGKLSKNLAGAIDPEPKQATKKQAAPSSKRSASPSFALPSPSKPKKRRSKKNHPFESVVDYDPLGGGVPGVTD